MRTAAEVKRAAAKPLVSTGKRNKRRNNKQPTQHNPKGVRHMVLGANGKIRWEWVK